VSFCLANDYEDNVFYQRYGYYKPYATVDDKGELVIKGRGFPNVRPTRLRTEETRKNVYRTILGSKTLAAFANALSAHDVDDQAQQSDALPDQQGLQGVYPEAETVLKNSAQALGIPFLGNVKQLTGDDFWQKDGHWNLQGHVKMATSIANYLSSSGLYAPEPKTAYK
jgi:hypothetical protein